MPNIRAKVMDVFGGGALAFNAGKARGVAKKMYFKILNNNQLVAIVQVTEVYDSFSIAEAIKYPDNTIPDHHKVAVGQDVVQE